MGAQQSGLPTTADGGVLERLRERTNFRRQLLATIVGAAIAFFSSGLIALYQARQQDRERLAERQIAAVKAYTQALGDAETIVAEEVQFSEACDGLRQRAERISSFDPAKMETEISKLDADDIAVNGQRWKLSTHWAQVEGSLRANHVELRALFHDVPDLPLPSIDKVFIPAFSQGSPQDGAARLRERITTYTAYRDAAAAGKTVVSNLVADQEAIAERLLADSSR